MFFHIQPANLYFTPVRGKHSCEKADECGFTGTIVSDNSNLLPGADISSVCCAEIFRAVHGT